MSFNGSETFGGSLLTEEQIQALSTGRSDLTPLQADTVRPCMWLLPTSPVLQSLRSLGVE